MRLSKLQRIFVSGCLSYIQTFYTIASDFELFASHYKYAWDNFADSLGEV